MAKKIGETPTRRSYIKSYEDQKKEVVQLQKEKEEEAVWQQQLKAVQGSHEGQQGKM